MSNKLIQSWLRRPNSAHIGINESDVAHNLTARLKELKESSANVLSLSQRNQILSNIVTLLQQPEVISFVLKQNEKDVMLARNEPNANLAFLDRLSMGHNGIISMREGVETIIKLPDPLNRILEERNLQQNGLNIKKLSCPIGVIMAIYESRPNVTLDVASLAIKSGNSVILKGGKESSFTSLALIEIIKVAMTEVDQFERIIYIDGQHGREITKLLLKQDKYIDMLIPRGGKGLIEAIRSSGTTIPIINHYDGNCHLYIHNDCDIDMAISITLNSKFGKLSACNAVESLVMDEKVAKLHLADLLDAMFDEAGAKNMDLVVVGCDKSIAIDGRIRAATIEDYYAEYLGPKVSLKIVNNSQEAIEWINLHSSSHTEAIVTNNSHVAQQFQSQINSAVIMWNTSTRFCDGFEFGMGAEVGISTSKIHARGPMGLNELTIYKYLVSSDGSIRI